MLVALLLLVIALMVVYWRLYLVGPSGDPFTRGPYMTSVTADGARFRWRTSEEGPVRIAARDAGGRTVTTEDGRLTGLAPGTEYAWTATVDGRVGASGTLRTPSADPARPVRFAVIADYGDGSDDQWSVARALAAARPEFVLTAGDNSYPSAPDILLDRNIFQPLGEVMRHAPFLVGMGDHDTLPPDGGAAMRRAFDLPDDDRYVVAWGGVQVIVIGVETRGAAPFVRRALEQGDFPSRFVVVHRPVRPGDPLLPLLRRRGVRAVFSGHLHLYERREVDGVRSFTVGTGGTGPGDAEFTPRTEGREFGLDDFGFLLVETRPGRVEYRFVDVANRVRDRFTQTGPAR